MSYQLDMTKQNQLINGNLKGDPFAYLGMHKDEQQGIFIRTFHPKALKIEVIEASSEKNLGAMEKENPQGLFKMSFSKQEFFSYRLKITLYDGHVYEIEDTYAFLPVLGELDLYLFSEGTHMHLYDKLGAHLMTHQGVQGVLFAVWAPNASRVSVVGQFNDWDGRRHPMRPRGKSGIWEIFIPRIQQWDLYKYELLDAHGRLLPLKADPFAFASEMRPKTGSLVFNQENYQWKDEDWLEKRKTLNTREMPMSIYEVHLGSWRRNSLENNRWLTYKELAKELTEYVLEMGFTHVEFLPVAEYPYDGSWGYQVTGLFAPTSRFGTPDDFKFLVDSLHQAGIGVIVDWVPAHFPKDAFGLANFDGTALYEHADPRKGEHMDWGTKIYNFGRTEVQEFLINNALFWIRNYHIDGLRVDAVASMLYLDYSRKENEWIPNKHGGRENLEAIHFLRRLNELVYGENTGVIMIAEESTAWPMVSKPLYMGGLGFGYKWNMGWMHDTLHYMHQNPIHRKYHQNELTFSFVYAFSENFILPLSHDEVVHGKGSMIRKMSGDRWQQFANLRAYYAFMFMHPGKKLLFMGDEFAQEEEWKFNDSLKWNSLYNEEHKGVALLVKNLNHFYKTHPSLYQLDCESDGFEWIDGSDADNSVISFIRKDKANEKFLVVVCNFTPIPRYNYRVGVPSLGTYTEVLNTDDKQYAGSGIQNYILEAQSDGWNFKPYSLNLTLPPLACIVLECCERK